MKKLLRLASAALALLAAPLAQAWTYNNGDVLLIFRNASNPARDVEYDIGSVNQFLGQTNGYTVAVTNWNPAIVQGVYGADLTGVSVALLAVSSSSAATPTAWVSGVEPNTTAYADSVSAWNYNYYSKLSNLGEKPENSGVAAAATNAYSINPYGVNKAASYEYIVSGGTYNGVSELGGSAPFVVEQVIPGALDFWAVQPLGGATPDHLVGTFNLTAGGGLTFTAGPVPASPGIARAGSLTSVNVGTQIGVSYQLLGAGQLGGGATWTPVGGPLTGDGNSHALNDTNTANVQFYRVTAQ
jgi:hypothetical protein